MSNLTMSQINELKMRTDMNQYVINSFNWFLEKIDFKDKKVLEIGGSSLSREFLFDYLGVSQWVSVDILGHSAGRYQQETYSSHYDETPIYDIRHVPESARDQMYCIIDGDATILPLDVLGKFDAIVSICCLEHLLAMPTIFMKCHTALNPGGALLSRFGPIWSSRVGHHVGIDKALNHNKPGPIDNWAHLLFDPPELYQHLLKNGLPHDRAQKVILQTYHEPRINRLFYEDYVNYASNSEFNHTSVSPSFVEDVPSEILEMLIQKYPGRRQFQAYGINLECIK